MKASISIEIIHSIHDIDASVWNALSGGQPFQSHAWFSFGEEVMHDCTPVYILAYEEERLAGRASFWVVHNEPLPQYVGLWRPILKLILNKWPLLICRSPLSLTSGVFISAEGSARNIIFSRILESALDVGKQNGCSFLLFDYLGRDQNLDWSPDFSVMEVPNPGTFMENRWNGFDDYLEKGNKKDRQHYKRTVREAEKLGIKITRSTKVSHIDEALYLIHDVEHQHGAPENPWMRNMLLKMDMVNGVFLTAFMNEKLVGCGLLLEDNNAQMATALGLSKQVPYVYLMLVYEGIKTALEENIRLMRWGSGAYEVKQRLGFEREDNGLFAFAPIQPAIRKLMKQFKWN